MLLKDNLYHIVESEKGEEAGTYVLRVSETFPLFKGHFPGSPVLPGVCILQIFKELAEMDLAVGTSLRYNEIKQCKFLQPVAMTKPVDLTVSLSLKQEGGFWNLSASLKDDATLFTTIKAVLTTIQ